jgi:hypothetical protein
LGFNSTEGTEEEREKWKREKGSKREEEGKEKKK